MDTKKAEARRAVIEQLAQVKNVGEFRAKKLYEDLNVRSVEELVELARQGELTKHITGIGAATEKKILDAALAMREEDATAEEQAAEEQVAEEQAAEEQAAEEQAAEEQAAEEQGEEPSEDAPETARSAEVLIASSDPLPEHTTSAKLDPVEAIDDLVQEDTVIQEQEARLESPGEEVGAPSLQSVLICPNCGHDTFIAEPGAGITCCACRREYVERRGVIDLIPPYRQPHSPSQRLMESRFYARFYEDVMRPRLTALVTSRTMREEYALSADLLDLEPDSRLLDVACGTANFTRYFARRFDAWGEDPSRALLVGVDLSAPMLEVARQHIAREDISQPIYLVRGDAARLPFERGAFDRVHCAAALHLVEDPDEVLRHIACVLEQDGLFVLTTFIRGKGIVRKLAKRLAEIPTKFKWFDRDALRKKVERAGFELLDEFIEEDAITLLARRV